MSQKLPAIDFKWVEDIYEFDESFIKCYNEESDEGCFIEVDVQYLENLHKVYNDLPFLPERIKIEIVEKLTANLHNKIYYVIHIKKLKLVLKLNHGLVLKKSHRIIKFNKKPWVRPHTDMNTELSKKAKK